MMTDSATDRQRQIFADIVAGCGGVERLDTLHVELATRVSALLASDDMTVKTADVIASLLDRLPKRPEGDDEDFRLERLSDADLRELERINCVARDVAIPDWVCPEPDAGPLMGVCEAQGASLGRFLDAHADEIHARPLSEPMRIELCNLFSSLGYCAGILTRQLWAPIWVAERESAVADAVIAEQDRAAKATAKTSPLATSIDTPPEPEPSNVVALGQYPPFSFNGGGKP